MKSIPYGRHQITQDDIEAVADVLSSSFLTQGPLVKAFELALTEKCLAKEAIALNSATSCLHVACLALDVKQGDLVWTTPNSFVASSNCALYCGAEVDFVDIDPVTGLIDEDELEKKVEVAKHTGKLPKVVIPVHLAGTSCNMERIHTICSDNNIRIIEDASHGLGGYYKGIPVGSCQYSDITVFSFHPVKMITTGEGGAALTNEPTLASRMRSLGSHGITKDIREFVETPAGPWAYEQQLLGFNYRMSDLQAALGISQLKRLEDIVKERNEVRRRYEDLLEGLPVRMLEVPKDCISSVHLVVISLLGEHKKRHKEIFENMRGAGIGVQLHYPPIHLQPYYKSLGFKEGSMKNAEEYAASAFTLPVYPGLEETDQCYIVKTLSGLLEQTA